MPPPLTRGPKPAASGSFAERQLAAAKAGQNSASSAKAKGAPQAAGPQCAWVPSSAAQQILDVLLDHGGKGIDQIAEIYAGRYGGPLDWKRFGFASLPACFNSLPGVTAGKTVEFDFAKFDELRARIETEKDPRPASAPAAPARTVVAAPKNGHAPARVAVPTVVAGPGAPPAHERATKSVAEERAEIGGAVNEVVTVMEKYHGPDGHNILPLALGQRLTVLHCDRSGWSYGRLLGGGAEGWYPHHFTKKIQFLKAEKPAPSPAARGGPAPAKDLQTASQGFTGDPAKSQLSLAKGDVVEVVQRHQSGWTFCRFPNETTKRGWVPDYVVKD